MLIRASEESQQRTLTTIGVVVAVAAVVAALAFAFNPFGGKSADSIGIAIDTPYLGPGVNSGTAVIMHGVKVGEVTAVSPARGGGVRLNAELQTAPVAGLTDTMGIDFRPANYFGVTGVNLIQGSGGVPLTDRAVISTTPRGDFTLSALLSRLGGVSSVMNSRLIAVIDRATRYTDAIDPLIETILTVSQTIANVQTVSTARMLANTTGLSVAMPSFVDALTFAGDNVLGAELVGYSDDKFKNGVLGTLDQAQYGLFGSVGRLVGSHVDDLTDLVGSFKGLVDLVPVLARPPDFSQTLAELRSRFEKMFAGNGEQRALQVRIVLDALPGVAAPLGFPGGPQ